MIKQKRHDMSQIACKVLYHFFTWLPDRLYVKLLYRFHLKKRLNLASPRTFNEKLQWLKLNNRRPEYTMMVDKYAVKDYVTRIIGDQYVIPTLGVWDKPEDIEWEKLPPRFVLKTTHGGGSMGVIVCKDKDTFDVQNAILRLRRSMKQDIYKYFKEWPYKNVRKRVFAERFVETGGGGHDLPDYKFFCFDGVVKAMFVATDRQTPGVDVKFDFFDADYNHLPFRQGHDHAAILPQKPKSFEEMKLLASRISAGIPQVRVDFYEVDGRPMFGEITFFHFAGLTPFEPDVWDEKFGSYITLPELYTTHRNP